MSSEAHQRLATEVLVIGSGAGGAVTAAVLAEAGRRVLIVEEGPEVRALQLQTNSPDAMRALYRNAGVTPILGRNPIAFVEGRCVGGSTEINSAFWHRPPESAFARWSSEYGVRDLSADTLSGAFAELEDALGVSTSGTRPQAPSSRVFREGLERLGAPAVETPRAQRGDPNASQFSPGAKQSMSRTYLPRAIQAGAELVSGCRVDRIQHRRGRAHTVSARRRAADTTQRMTIEAEVIFVCGGAIQTPALLRRSGIRSAVGDNLCIQPMLKVAAQFDEILDGHRTVMPVYQIRDPESGVFLGGSVFTPGFLAMTLSERWPANAAALCDWRSMALFYTACRGSARGSVRVFPLTGEAVVRYRISPEDRRNLSAGVARLCEVLFAGGATRVFPGLRDHPPMESAKAAQSLARNPLPTERMNLSTVHVSSSCPMGEREGRCPVDSFGRLRGFENVYLADASIVPDAPGVNPQGTVMALALRNARRFLA